MNDSETRARATWRQARQDLGGDVTALEFGDTVSAVAIGGQSEAARVIRLPLGLDILARKYFLAAKPGESVIEAAIAEVEELIMPLRPLVPVGSRCVTRDHRVALIARALGLPPEAWIALTTNAVEDVFNRWAAIALGRPASQDTLPTTPEFAASLLVLREWLHHFSFTNIRATLIDAGN